MSGAPYVVSLEDDTARELTQNGAAVLLLNVPEGTIIGIDQQRFQAGPRFSGVKMVPPGTHFFSYCAVSKDGDVSPTTFFVLHLEARQVIVRQWDPSLELLLPVADEDQAERYMTGVRNFDFDRGLAPYNLSARRSWLRLSLHVSAGVIQRLAPSETLNLSVTAEPDPTWARAGTVGETELEESLQRQRREVGTAPGVADAAHGMPGPSGRQQHVGRCVYPRLPRLLRGSGYSVEELTQHNMDKSRLLEEIFRDVYHGSEDDFLGDFQFSFIAFWLGHSLEGYAFWRGALSMVLGCEAALTSGRGRFFTLLIRTLRAQIAQSWQGDQNSEPGPLLESLADDVLQDSFLRRSISTFLQTLHNLGPAVDQELQREGRKLTDLAKRLGWNPVLEGEEDMDDEDAPVVVDL